MDEKDADRLVFTEELIDILQESGLLGKLSIQHINLVSNDRDVLRLEVVYLLDRRVLRALAMSANDEPAYVRRASGRPATGTPPTP